MGILNIYFSMTNILKTSQQDKRKHNGDTRPLLVVVSAIRQFSVWSTHIRKHLINPIIPVRIRLCCVVRTLSRVLAPPSVFCSALFAFLICMYNFHAHSRFSWRLGDWQLYRVRRQSATRRLVILFFTLSVKLSYSLETKVHLSVVSFLHIYKIILHLVQRAKIWGKNWVLKMKVKRRIGNRH